MPRSTRGYDKNYPPRNACSTRDYFLETRRTYWIYVVIHELFENLDMLMPFITVLENFGASLETRAEVILPNANTYARNRKDLLLLDWNQQVKNLLAQKKNPYMLIIPGKLYRFKPKLTDYVIIDFPNPTNDLTSHFDILFELANEIKTKDRIADWKYITMPETKIDGLVSNVINTGGGSIIEGNISTNDGDFVSRDKIVTVINIYLHM